MLNKTVFKQCLQGNGKLWLVFTLASCMFLALIIVSFDAEAFAALAGAADGTKFSGMASSMGTLIGTTEMFFTSVATLLGLVYVLFTANSLVADEVDSGSMAYTLSTPVRRSSVVATKLVYLVSAVTLMFVIVAGVGFATAEFKWGAVSGTTITEDVSAAAKALDKKPQYVRTHLYTILESDRAVQDGAEARNMDESAYRVYLELRMDEDAYQAVADKLTEDRYDEYRDVTGDDRPSDEEIEITADELKADPSLAMGDDDALKEGASCKGMTLVEYRDFLQKQIDGEDGTSEQTVAADPAAQGDPATADASQATQIPATTQALLANPSDLLQVAMTAASNELGVSASSIADNMTLMKDSKALEAEAAATGVPAEQLSQIIDQAMASTAIAADEGTDFDNESFAWLNIGCYLVVLAFSSISFFASCLFNRSGAAMVLGGGLPFVFFLVSIMVQMSDSLENLKYLTITTLFDSGEIIAMGDFGLGLAALAAIAVVLYTAGCVIFCKKDLPL